jgi:hypothetical protein
MSARARFPAQGDALPLIVDKHNQDVTPRAIRSTATFSVAAITASGRSSRIDQAFFSATPMISLSTV